MNVRLVSAAACVALLLAPAPGWAARPDLVATAEKVDITLDAAGAAKAWQAALATAPKPGPRRAHILAWLGTSLLGATRVDEAVPILREALATPGIAPHDRAHATTLLGSALTDPETFDKAEATLKDAVAQWHAIAPQGSAEEADAIHTLAVVHFARGDLETAASLEQQAFEMSRRVKAPENAQLVAMMSSMAMVALQAGKLQAGETYAREAVTAAGRALPEDHPMAILAVNNYATVLAAQNRRAEIVDLLRRIAMLEEKRFGPGYAGLAITYNNLGRTLAMLGRLDEAEPHARRAVATGEKTLQPADQRLAAFRSNLADLLDRRGQKAEAASIWQKALADLGDANPVREMAIRSALAKNLLATGDDRAASAQFAIVNERQEKTLPETHPDRIATAGSRALLAARLKQAGAGADLARALDLTERELFADADPERRSGIVADHLARLLEASWLIGDRAAGFRIAQLMALDDAGRAIVAVSARAVAGDGATALLVRKRQDLLAQRDKLVQATLAAYGKGDTEYRAATADVAKVDAALKEAEAALAAAHPDHAALTHFAALDEAAVAKRLAPNEALLMPVPFKGGAITFALRRSGGDWARSTNGVDILADASTLRASLGLDLGTRGALADAPVQRPRFDRALAHKLYRDIIPASLDKRLSGATSWVLAPGGGLSKLPFAVLVTEPPRSPDDTPASLRSTSWLIRKAALTQVPMLTGSDGIAATQRPGDRFVGIGAPALSGKASPGDLRGFYRGGAVNRDALAALAPLPQAERELKRMEAALGLKPSLLVGAAATETAVKAENLKGVRVLAFATHGLVGGAIDKGSEPGLVLTPPAQPTAADDGLLTASEIAGLDIDADWVVLSACDTAAGESPSAPALSGLARAFLYAGARSLLVSHWAVRDDVAARLTVDTATRAARGEARPQALRKAMLDLIADKQVEGSTDPSVWAPFILVAR